MRTLALTAFGMLALASTISVDTAAARDGCGPGRYYNGYRCTSMGGPPPGYYGGPGYGPGYGRGYGPREGYGYERSYGPPRISVGRSGKLSCNNPGYTVQDGVCKPYRGP